MPPAATGRSEPVSEEKVAQVHPIVGDGVPGGPEPGRVSGCREQLPARPAPPRRDQPPSRPAAAVGDGRHRGRRCGADRERAGSRGAARSPPARRRRDAGAPARRPRSARMAVRPRSCRARRPLDRGCPRGGLRLCPVRPGGGRGRPGMCRPAKSVRALTAASPPVPAVLLPSSYPSRWSPARWTAHRRAARVVTARESGATYRR